MFHIQKLLGRPKIFHTLTGLTPNEFTHLLQKVHPLWIVAQARKKSWDGRKRAVGGGRKRDTDLATDIFLLLLYYRTYVSHVFVGLLVDLDETNIGRRIRELEPLLAQVFRIPKKKIQMSEKELLELIVDATEQQTQRRKGTRYSGKKKQQTIKTQIHISKDGIIRAVSDSITGNRHDKHLYDISHTYVRGPDGNPKRVRKKGDLGYIGTECEVPAKKPKSRPLMMHEEYQNRQHSKQRILVEHEIAHLKKFHCLSDCFRGNPKRYNLMFRNVAGLRNFIRTASS